MSAHTSQLVIVLETNNQTTPLKLCNSSPGSRIFSFIQIIIDMMSNDAWSERDDYSKFLIFFSY